MSQPAVGARAAAVSIPCDTIGGAEIRGDYMSIYTVKVRRPTKCRYTAGPRKNDHCNLLIPLKAINRYNLDIDEVATVVVVNN